mmetsp:Transcript_14055/g.42878  ORF Transcript_14055/g.42878 Transcript_14055/m.42878 type:complete len:214 (+) Transcript_14055:1775-2416(+)|eukprot:scaffold287355_cov33-Tisochrysis_lutea.AAC.4
MKVAESRSASGIVLKHHSLGGAMPLRRILCGKSWAISSSSPHPVDDGGDAILGGSDGHGGNGAEDGLEVGTNGGAGAVEGTGCFKIKLFTRERRNKRVINVVKDNLPPRKPSHDEDDHGGSDGGSDGDDNRGGDRGGGGVGKVDCCGCDVDDREDGGSNGIDEGGDVGGDDGESQGVDIWPDQIAKGISGEAGEVARGVEEGGRAVKTGIIKS